MSIREKIEKLRGLWAITPWLRGKYIRRADVLSVLGECVAEHYASKPGVLIFATEDDEFYMLEGIEPGDHVTVYVRKR